MTHIGRWNLVERTPADIEADVRAAAPPGTVAGLDITADATGLTLFATVRRADEGDPRSRLRVRRRRSLDRQSRPSMMRKSRSTPSASAASASW
jgi:hypothetical protein